MCLEIGASDPVKPGVLTRALKFRERLGDKSGIDDPFPAKHKHMRWATYEKLEEEYYRLNQAWAVGIMARFRS